MFDELARIKQEFGMGFLTGYEAMRETFDVLELFANDIEDEDEKDAWHDTIYASHRDNEKINDAFREISEQWEKIFEL